MGNSVIIVGGTGFLGYHAALEFLRRGYQVSSLAIPDVELEGWYPKEIRVMEGDVFSMTPARLKECFTGHDAMVYAIGPDDRIVPSAPALDFFREKLVDTGELVFNAARESGVKRAVLLGSYLSHFHRLLPHLELARRHPYISARIEQADVVIRASGQEMETMILELPYVFGSMPIRIPLWREAIFERILKMNPVFYTDGGSSMVCVESVAQAIAGAVERGRDGMMYPIGDDNLRWEEMFNIIFKALEIRRKFIHVPYWIASLAGRMIMWRDRTRLKEPGLNMTYIFKDILSREFYLDAATSVALLGYTPCDVREAIAQTAKACYPGGYKNRKSVKPS